MYTRLISYVCIYVYVLIYAFIYTYVGAKGVTRSCACECNVIAHEPFGKVGFMF